MVLVGANDGWTRCSAISVARYGYLHTRAHDASPQDTLYLSVCIYVQAQGV